MPLPAKNIKKPDEKQMQYRDGNGGQKSVQIDKEKQIASVHPFLVQSGLAAARSKPPDQSITSQMIDIEIVALKNLFKDADSINGKVFGTSIFALDYLSNAISFQVKLLWG